MSQIESTDGSRRPEAAPVNGTRGWGEVGERPFGFVEENPEGIASASANAKASANDGVDRSVEPVDLAARAVEHGRNEWQWFFSAIVIAATVIVGVHVGLNSVGGIPFAGLALSLCATTTGLAMGWRRGRLGAKNPVAATLLTVAMRTLVMMGALVFVAATKWTYLNSFASSLLGCYFLFLVLESVLSVRWYSSLTRVVES